MNSITCSRLSFWLSFWSSNTKTFLFLFCLCFFRLLWISEPVFMKKLVLRVVLGLLPTGYLPRFSIFSQDLLSICVSWWKKYKFIIVFGNCEIAWQHICPTIYGITIIESTIHFRICSPCGLKINEKYCTEELNWRTILVIQVCSDINKPNGQFILPNDRRAIVTFVSSLPIRKVCGHYFYVETEFTTLF